METELLKKINNPADLRTLTMSQLNQLAGEIRHLIKISVSQNGGHLASNLGVVELTIALHYVFDFSKDSLVWDVGHQCYPHKILTGRAERFHTLRQGGGISGFPDPSESPYDKFFVGHAGTAIPTALGLALGAQMKHSHENIVAVVGDASIVNGLAFEGLNNTSLLKRQMLIILNDNSMAIDKTQGAFAQYLTRLRLSRPYEDLEKHTKQIVQCLPYFGDAIHDTIDRIKGGLKTTLMGRQRFEQLGIPLYGPVDGHDISSLIKILTALRHLDHPVLFHICTEKGRGFVPASKDPRAFHSTVPFTVDGETISFADRIDRSFTAAFTHSLSDLMARDESIVALTAAMCDGTGLAQLRASFPDRIIDVGIAESAAVDIAAGLAKSGMKPVVAIYSTFMQRCFDQLFQEVALQNLPVVLCMDRAGLVGSDGATHHGCFDIAYIRCLPNMILMSPMDEREISAALTFALQSGKPCVLRYPRDLVPVLDKAVADYHCPPFELGRAAWLRRGRDAVVIAYGKVAYDALLAANMLETEGIDLAVVSARFAKPLDEQLLTSLLEPGRKMPIITLEEHFLSGGFGSAVLEFGQNHKLDTNRIHCMALPDRFIEHNTRRHQLDLYHLSTNGIADTVRQILNVTSVAHQEQSQPGKTLKIAR
ncbi:MAG: 1-deoxy-D-xylulose-5-phosphate synthase [Sedimentisphaerales bacterium]|nr:1-deoxy-D-xylulose-5-phosphate synthase [Sedimentisphaerales bacterium]